jgi:ssDNA-binding replication factor A large subunit
MKASIWDDFARAVRPGDVLNMLKVYTNVFKSQLTINVGKFGEVVKAGE